MVDLGIIVLVPVIRYHHYIAIFMFIFMLILRRRLALFNVVPSLVLFAA